MARIVIFDETVRGVDLPGEPVILGRSRKADIPIHDHLLSRKHCTIVPHPAGLRLIDLKSSNGTFVNGKRIERGELKSDDVIEIGNTVIVILENDRWKKGEGLPRLRNPAKARELIRTLERRGVVPTNGRVGSRPGRSRPGPGSRAGLRQKKKLTPSEAAFVAWAREEFPSRPAARRLLEQYLENRIVSLLVRNSRELRKVLSAALERILVADAFSGDLDALREKIRRSLDDALAARTLPPEEAPAAEAASRKAAAPEASGEPPAPQGGE